MQRVMASVVYTAKTDPGTMAGVTCEGDCLFEIVTLEHRDRVHEHFYGFYRVLRTLQNDSFSHSSKPAVAGDLIPHTFILLYVYLLVGVSDTDDV